MTARGTLSATEWVAAGLDLLRSEGEDALTIQRLCERLDRTKGSFYHHFEDVTAFHEALLDAWEAQLTTAVIEAASSGADIAAFAELLSDAARSIDVRLELSVRSWAIRSERAMQRVRRVDERRLAALQLFPSPSTPRARRTEQLLTRALKSLGRRGGNRG
jgi:AcrR family transcriptional regulator